MHRVLFALLIVGCAASTDPTTQLPGGGGKADGDSSADGGIDAAEMHTLTGTCRIKTDQFYDGGGGSTDTETDPIELATRIDSIDATGHVLGTVHVSSPWETIPEGLWRAWCHIGNNDLQPLGNACAVGPYDIATSALGFGYGDVSFTKSDTGFTMYISAYEELDRSSYEDESFTRVSYSCSLQ